MAKYIVFVATIIVFFVSLCTSIFVQVPTWTNMTDAQVDAQTDRWFMVQAEACQKAGGYWEAGFSQAECTVGYPAPDTSWWKQPILNPAYSTWQIVHPILIVVACISGLLVLILGVMILEDRR